MASRSPPELPNDVGPYHFLQVIGEGGMGIVYEAEQLEPVRRRVAVKMMKVGLDTKEVVGRFEVERQALAVMDHPGIAKVLDGGATEQGRPYFVMELVRGVRLDEYCDHQRLATRQRIELFVQVCEAVQHAHQKGVIHRDLKPSNILVTEDGGRPLPKVIDFGVAKATGRRLTNETVVTTYGQALGTLAYMSPEQAEMSGLDVDTRADVYSLGVTLYQLLAGTVPSDPGEVGAPTFLAQLIQRDQTMPTLARRLSTLSQERLDIVAGLRATDRSGLRKELAGDLQWIVQRAMEKDRARRYETANGLAMDLKRYLADEPVVARPPTARYRAAKFVRRNRTAVLAACVAFLAVSAGAVAATVGMVRAQEAEMRATQEAATAMRVTDFLVDLFRVSDPDQARGAEITAREVLDRGAEQIVAELGGEPLVQAQLMHTIAEVYESLGLYGSADDMVRRAIEIRRAELGTDHEDVAESLVLLSMVVGEAGDLTGSVDLLLEALDIFEARVGPNDPRTARVINNLAGSYSDLARYDEALPMLERTLEIRESTSAPDHPQVAATLYNLALLHRRLERYDTAAALYRRALDIRETALGADHPAVARTLNGLANTLVAMEQYDSAEALYRRSLADKERTLGPNHPDVATTLNNLAILFARQDRPIDAAEMFEHAYERRLAAFGPDHPSVAVSLNNLGAIRHELGELQSSADAYARAADIYRRTLGADHPRLAETLDNYGNTLRDLGRDAEADAVEAEAAAIRAARGN